MSKIKEELHDQIEFGMKCIDVEEKSFRELVEIHKFNQFTLLFAKSIELEIEKLAFKGTEFEYCHDTGKMEGLKTALQLFYNLVKNK